LCRYPQPKKGGESAKTVGLKLETELLLWGGTWDEQKNKEKTTDAKTNSKRQAKKKLLCAEKKTAEKKNRQARRSGEGPQNSPPNKKNGFGGNIMGPGKNERGGKRGKMVQKREFE